MLGFDDVNRAVGNFGTSLGNLGAEFGKAQVAQREGYKAKSIAALGQGNVAEAIRYARLADPSSTVGDDFTHAFGPETVAKPGAVNPAANLATTPTPGAPAPTLAPKPVPSWNNPTGDTAASLPTTLTPAIGSMPAPADLATQATDALGPQQKWMGVNPRRIGLGDGADETITQQSKDLGVDPTDRGNITKMAAYLGIQKPDPKYSSVDGHGLVEITPGYAGLPAEAKTILAERLGMKDRAGLLLDKAKLDQTRQLTLAEIKARIDLGNQDDGTRRWIAGLGDGTERWKATLSARAKAAGMNDDTAKSIAAIANAVRGQYPRRKDAMDRFTETDDEYEARVAPVMKAWLSESNINLPDVPNAAPPTRPAPAVPVAPPAVPAGGGWPSLPNLGDAFGGRPAPAGPSTPPAKLPALPRPPAGATAAPKAPAMPATQKATAASASSVARGEEIASKVRVWAPFVKVKSVNPTTGDVVLDYDPKKLTKKQRKILEDLDPNANLYEEEGYPPRYQVLGTDPAPAAAPTQPSAKPTPNGATPRMQQLLNQTKPRD